MLEVTYAPGLVGMSIIVAIVAAYTAIDMARRLASAGARAARWWLVGGAVAMGTGIWAMHFVGMLAISLPIPMGYDPLITFASWAIAVAASAFALWLTGRPRLGLGTLAAGALVMGGGISGMHYAGMAAMRMQPGVDYKPGLLVLSIAVAVVVAGVGLYVIHVMRGVRQRARRLHALAAVVIGFSIVGMHYIGMAAARFPVGSVCGAAQHGLQVGWLASLIIVGALGVLTMALLASLLDQRADARLQALTASLADANQELDRLALHDPLTRLPNRLLLEERLAQAAVPGARFAVLFVDLDGFKGVNDAFGHHAGDLVLFEMAQRLGARCRHGEVVARQGGDEFVLLAQVTTREGIAALAQRLVELIRQPVVAGGQALSVSASIGIAVYPDDATDPSLLLSHADAAMEATKQRGRNGYGFFESALNAEAQESLQLSQALLPGLARREFYVLYQPKYNAADSALVGVEALVRWHHPTRGIVGPDVFIPLAERSGVIVELGAFVLDEACRQLADWHRQGVMLQMSVNLSVLQFASPHLIDEVEACLRKHAVPPRYLTLEITESTAMQDVEHSLRMLRQLRKLGVEISIDDFGTGYSSLAYLKRLPASELKIDRSFVQNLTEGHEDAAIVTAVIALGRTLGLAVTAEGVETSEQRDFLVREGCDILQGFLLSRPVEAAAVALDGWRARVAGPTPA
ncbi:MAG TPA: bifunctional diguanylate cyclase/phosphodiesterase [Rhodanobacteraceae bacterium]|nr:bifunctional diguanylate cyclase/phosphodiesterase [Rhodanobacteraceae bacterium]